MQSLLSRLASPSLSLRDDTHIRSSDKRLMSGPLVWLSNQIPISPEIYRRLLVFIDGFSSIVDPEAHRSAVPWMEIFRALGVIYLSFVETLGLNEEKFVEFAQRTHCLSQPGMKDILESVSNNSAGIDVGNSDFPIHLLRSWTKSTSLHTSDIQRKQRYSDEIVLKDLINDISSTPQDLLATWYGLLDDEVKEADRVLLELLRRLASGPEEQQKQRLDTTLYLISTGYLPWQSTVSFYGGNLSIPSNALVRKLRASIWVRSLSIQQQKAIILQRLSDFKRSSYMRILLIEGKITEEETAELQRMGFPRSALSMRLEEQLSDALNVFDQLLENTEGQEARRDLTEWMVIALCEDLTDSHVSLDPKYLRVWQIDELTRLSNPILRLIACVTLEGEWKDEWSPGLLEAKEHLREAAWERASKLRLRLWIHFSSEITGDYLRNIIDSFDNLKRVEQELSLARVGIDKASDFLLALLHLNCAYSFIGLGTSPSLSFIPTIVTEATPLFDTQMESTEVVDYLSSICVELKTEPARLIRLLIELIRADINHDPQYRRPQDLQKLLKHAESYLFGKELRPFSPSCRRLARYIRISYQQFEETWDNVLNGTYTSYDPRQHYAQVDRGELKAVYERVVALLETVETWKGEVHDISWPRHLLRPTGTKQRPFEEDVEGEVGPRDLTESKVGDGGKPDEVESLSDDQLGGSNLPEEVLVVAEGAVE
ncbi:hypothetical protein FRC17_004937 [Serendipita sp. 399]|nr:hypothetical protein FRC17_004937 [Serendipita sp. 399]